jgi:hypothetical protein
MNESRPIGSDCPYCSSPMTVTQMSCQHCKTAIQADFPMSRLGRMPVEHQRFIEMFLLSGGNLKEIAEQVGVRIRRSGRGWIRSSKRCGPRSGRPGK